MCATHTVESPPLVWVPIPSVLPWVSANADFNLNSCIFTVKARRCLVEWTWYQKGFPLGNTEAGSEIKGGQSKRFVFVNSWVRNTQRGREVKSVIYK